MKKDLSWITFKEQLQCKDKKFGFEIKWAGFDEMVGWHHQLDGHEFE